MKKLTHLAIASAISLTLLALGCGEGDTSQAEQQSLANESSHTEDAVISGHCYVVTLNGGLSWREQNRCVSDAPGICDDGTSTACNHIVSTYHLAACGQKVSTNTCTFGGVAVEAPTGPNGETIVSSPIPSGYVPPQGYDRSTESVVNAREN